MALIAVFIPLLMLGVVLALGRYEELLLQTKKTDRNEKTPSRGLGRRHGRTARRDGPPHAGGRPYRWPSARRRMPRGSRSEGIRAGTWAR